MRQAFCRSLVIFAPQTNFVFLTGDLGFQALEPLREAMGRRFINAGVAEQNMVGVAAGLAHEGFLPWAYSIAPFIYARPFEQIRNDICLHRHPVCLVGNGGGYGYGVMGATHHALEDYGTLLTLPHIKVFVPTFASDVDAVVKKQFQAPQPCYLRLGRCEKPSDYQVPAYAPWRELVAGNGGVIVAVGPLAGGLIEALHPLSNDKRPALWSACELPFHARDLPSRLKDAMSRGSFLLVIEEHGAHGSVGAMLLQVLATEGNLPRRFKHLHAQHYPSGLYGSQSFHRQECGLDVPAILAAISELTAAPY